MRYMSLLAVMVSGCATSGMYDCTVEKYNFVWTEQIVHTMMTVSADSDLDAEHFLRITDADVKSASCKEE